MYKITNFALTVFMQGTNLLIICLTLVCTLMPFMFVMIIAFDLVTTLYFVN